MIIVSHYSLLMSVQSTFSEMFLFSMITIILEQSNFDMKFIRYDRKRLKE